MPVRQLFRLSTPNLDFESLEIMRNTLVSQRLQLMPLVVKWQDVTESMTKNKDRQTNS
jgi:predicted transcriptional regulator